MRRSALAAALVGLLAVGAAPAVAQQQAELVPAGEAAAFPERSFRLTVPHKRVLTLDQLRLTENGDPVSGLTLTSASGPRANDFGTVLLIDTSKSMQGRPIREAMEAARLFAKERTGNQQLGVILFNGRTRVLVEPTTDANALENGLRPAPYLAPKTQIFDAVNAGMDLLAKAKITAGSIVVMSDGADSGSVISGEAVAKRARKANIRIFTVGMRSGSFDASNLKDLAAVGRGRYIPAERTSAYGPILRDLGAQLASEYLIRYRSAAKPRTEVTVAARVAGVEGIATSTYRVPGDATFVLIEKSFWTSTIGIISTTALFALLLLVAFGVTLGRHWKGPGVRDRIGGFVSMPEESVRQELVEMGRNAPGAAERSLDKTQWWPAFKEKVEIARIETDPVKMVVWTAIGSLLLLYLMSRRVSPIFGVLIALVPPVSLRAYVQFKLDRQRKLFADQLPDILQGSASAIRAGHGLTGALSMVVEDAPEPSRTEFRRVVTDEQLGVPLDQALRVVSDRMDSRDVQQIALVAQIQRDTGGNTAEVLDRVTEALRRRAELRRMISALTAQGRLSRWVVTLLPLVLLIIIAVLNPDYVDPLFNTTLGNVMLAIGAALMITGSLVIKKIVDFKV